ncbi:MAG: TIGR01777 family oxidoreductase [Acidimicrobiales bacterium]
MRVGITGASGFIGTALVSALSARGDTVVAFVRPGGPTRPGPTVRWDPERHLIDDTDWRREGHLDAVVNLAGAGIADRRWTEERKRAILSSRVSSTALLVEALREAPGGAPFLASASAVGYYGSRGDEVLTEQSASGGDFLARVCRQWEDEARSLSAVGAGVATLRTGIVLSARGGALAAQLHLFRAGLGGRLGTGDQWLSPITLADLVRAILFVVDRRLEGPVNLVGPYAVTNRAFTSALARTLHRPALLPVPRWALRLALGAELADGAVLASQRVSPRGLLASGFTFRHDEISTALRIAVADRG